MIEILSTIEIEHEGQTIEMPTSAIARDPERNFSLFRWTFLPAKAQDNFEFCGHAECFAALTFTIDFNLN